MAYGRSNDDVICDVTWPWKVKVVIPISLRSVISYKIHLADICTLWAPSSLTLALYCVITYSQLLTWCFRLVFRMMSDTKSVCDSSTASSAAPIRRPSKVDNPQSSSHGSRGHYHGLRRATFTLRPSVDHDSTTGHPSRPPSHRLLDYTYCMEPQQNDRFQPAVVDNMLGNAIRNRILENLGFNVLAACSWCRGYTHWMTQLSG